MQLKCFSYYFFVIFIWSTLTSTWSASSALNCNTNNCFSDVTIHGINRNNKGTNIYLLGGQLMLKNNILIISKYISPLTVNSLLLFDTKSGMLTIALVVSYKVLFLSLFYLSSMNDISYQQNSYAHHLCRRYQINKYPNNLTITSFLLKRNGRISFK